MLIHLHRLFSLYRLILSLKQEAFEVLSQVLLILQQWLGSFSVSDLHGICLCEDKMLNKNCSKNQNKQAAQEDSYNSGVGVCSMGSRNFFSKYILHSIEGTIVGQWVDAKKMAQ